MNFILSYYVIDHTMKEKIEKFISDTLSPFKYVKNLSSFYIVRVQDEQDWQKIYESLSKYAKSYPRAFYFIMSPIVYRGRYNGWLPADSWSSINDITD